MAIGVPTSKTKKGLDGISKKIEDTKLKLKDFLFPLIIVIVLLLVIFLLLVPMIGNAIEFRTELKEVERKQEQLEELKVKLAKIDDEQMYIDLLDVKTVTPKTLKVASFVYYIDELAREMNLSSKSISASDVNTASVSNSEKEEQYKGVSGSLAYTGTLDDVLDFLDSFYTSSPYIVSPRNISLEEKSSTEEWELTLNLTGFYIDDVETTRVDIYRAFKPYTDFSTEMKMLREKAIMLRTTSN